MLLTVDIGNTNIVIGFSSLEHDAPMEQTWRIHTDIHRTGDEYTVMLRSFFRDTGVDVSAVTRCGISSVVPLLTEPFVFAIRQITACIPVVVAPGIYHNLPIIVPQSAVHEIGADLVCNAVAAYTMYKSACIVIDFGTAMTFTSVADNGEICGVAITPGLITAVNALFNNTAQLPSVPLEIPPSSLGMNTVQSIQVGVVLGFAGLVETLVSRIKNDMKKNGFCRSECPVVATGGLSSVVGSQTTVFDRIDINLTLKGLRQITLL